MSNINSVSKVVNRLGTNSVKWDGLKNMFGDKNLLPLWVADMDFKSPECVLNAINNNLHDAAFGYMLIPDSYYESFINWEARHHNYTIERSFIRTSTGVVPAIYQLIGALSQENDSIMVLTPVYYPFMNAVKDTQRKLVTSSLNNNNGYYTMDFEDIKEKIISNNIKLVIFCSPHNPVGRVWKHDELEQFVSICKQNDVIIISDEIHHDLILQPNIHIPTALAGDYSQNVITLTSASKTFNLAGMKNSFIIIESERIRNKYDKWCKKIGTVQSSTLDYIAVEAAYNYGESWLAQVLTAIYENYTILKDELSEFSLLQISPLEGTYLLWIDFKEYISPKEINSFVQDKCKIAPDYGSWFTTDRAKPDTHIRINLATSKENILRAAYQIKTALKERAKL